MFSAKDLFFTSAATGAFTVAKSLRFRSGSSTYLNRTFSTPTSTTIWTLSAWIKRGGLTGTYRLFGASTTTYLTFNSSDQINLTINGVSAATSTAVFRDPSAWYHIVYQQNGSAQTIYVNNQSVATGTTAASVFNTAIAHQLGAANTTNYFDGYMAEVYFIDGQALDPTYFGQTDTATGVWMPKAYTGTYGTNGFYLKFTDVGSTSGSNTGYGKDFAGTNYWTTNNFNTTSTSTSYDSMVDTPTNATGDIGNYCVLNPLSLSGATLANANLRENAAAACSVFGTMALDGKFYFEDVLTFTQAGWSYLGVALTTTAPTAPTTLGGMPSNYWIWRDDGYKANAGTSSAYGTAISTGQIGMVAYDQATGKLWFGGQGTWFGSGDPAAGTNPSYTLTAGTSVFPLVGSQGATGVTIHDVNFGQRPFTYTLPSGFKALCTQNLPTPTIINGAQYMDATLYTGSASTQSVTNSGSMQPDLVWIKDRTSAQDNKLTDAVRGTTKGLISNTTGDETTDSNGVTAFNANGFSLGTGTRAYSDSNADSYVAWQWKESATSGFDIVTYTGNGSARTISHSLNAVPNMIIVKARTTASTDQGWPVYHSANTSAPETDYLMLNTTAATADLNTVWNDTAPTSSVFSVGTNANVNANNDTYVAYLWCAIAGYSAFGSYTGNGLADGPFVYCGFRPRYILTKRTDSTGNWEIYDTSRDTYNVMSADLSAESSAAETSTARFDALSNGFKIRTTGAATNASGGTYIFAVFAETPFNYSRGR